MCSFFGHISQYHLTKPHAFSFFVFFCRRLKSSEEDAKRQKAFLEDRCSGLADFICSSTHDRAIHLAFRLREAEVRVKRGDNNEIKVQIKLITFRLMSSRELGVE